MDFSDFGFISHRQQQNSVDNQQKCEMQSRKNEMEDILEIRATLDATHSLDYFGSLFCRQIHK